MHILITPLIKIIKIKIIIMIKMIKKILQPGGAGIEQQANSVDPQFLSSACHKVVSTFNIIIIISRGIIISIIKKTLLQ